MPPSSLGDPSFLPCVGGAGHSSCQGAINPSHSDCHNPPPRRVSPALQYCTTPHYQSKLGCFSCVSPAARSCGRIYEAAARINWTCRTTGHCREKKLEETSSPCPPSCTTPSPTPSCLPSPYPCHSTSPPPIISPLIPLLPPLLLLLLPLLGKPDWEKICPELDFVNTALTPPPCFLGQLRGFFF